MLHTYLSHICLYFNIRIIHDLQEAKVNGQIRRSNNELMYGAVNNYNFNSSALKSPYSQSQLSLEQSNWEQPFSIRDIPSDDNRNNYNNFGNQDLPKSPFKSNIPLANSVGKQRPQSAASKLGGGYSMPSFGKYVPPVIKSSNIAPNSSVFSNRRYQRRQVILIQKHIRGYLVRKRVSKSKSSNVVSLIDPSHAVPDDNSIVTKNVVGREKLKVEVARIEIAKYMQLERAKLLAEKREIENYLKIQRKNYEDELVLVRDASEKALRRVQEVAKKQIIASSAGGYKSTAQADITYDTWHLYGRKDDERPTASARIMDKYTKPDATNDSLGPIPGLSGKYSFKPMKSPIKIAGDNTPGRVTNIFLSEINKSEKVRRINSKDTLQYMRRISNNLTRRKKQRRALKQTYYNKFASVIQAAIRGYLHRKKHPKMYMIVEKALKMKERELLQREKQLSFTYADIFKQAKEEAQVRHETEVLKMLKKLKNIEKRLGDDECLPPDSMGTELELGVAPAGASIDENLKEYLSVSDNTKKWLRDITNDAVTFLLSDDYSSSNPVPGSSNNILSSQVGRAAGIQFHIDSIFDSNRIKDIRYISAMQMPMREYATCFLGIWDVLVMWKVTVELLRLNFFELLLHHYTKPTQERLQNEDEFINFIKLGRSYYSKRCNKLKIVIYNIAVTFGLELEGANVITRDMSNILEKHFDLYDIEKLKTVGFECATYHERLIRSWDHYYHEILQHKCDADYFIGSGAAFLDVCLDLSKEITACGYDIKQATSILLQAIDQEKLVGLLSGVESIMFIDDEIVDTYKLEQSEIIYSIITLDEVGLLHTDRPSEIDLNIKKSELAMAVVPSPSSSVLENQQPRLNSDEMPKEVPVVISYSITEQIKLSKLFKIFLSIWETMLASCVQKIILSANFQNYISDLIMSLTKQKEEERGVLREEMCKLAKHTSTTLTSTYASHLMHHQSSNRDGPRKIYETSRNVTECIHDLNRLLNSGRAILHRYDKFYIFKKECQLINPSNDDDGIINGTLVCIDEAIGNVLVTLGGFLSSISIRLMHPAGDSSSSAIYNIDIDTCWSIIGSKLISSFTMFAESFGISLDQSQSDQITADCRKILVLSLRMLKDFDWNEFWNKREDYKRVIKDEQYLFAVVTEAERLMFSPLNEHDQYEIDISSDLFKIIQQAVSE